MQPTAPPAPLAPELEAPRRRFDRAVIAIGAATSTVLAVGLALAASPAPAPVRVPVFMPPLIQP
jgi:hypothetical protein